MWRDQLGSDDPVIRRQAVAALTVLGARPHDIGLERLATEDASPAVREAAFWAIGLLAPSQAEQRFRQGAGAEPMPWLAERLQSWVDRPVRHPLLR